MTGAQASRLLFLIRAARSRQARRLRSGRHFRETANESPSAAKFADGEHQFIPALLQRQIDHIIFRVNDAEKGGVAKVLRAAATEEDLPVEKNTHSVAIA